MLHPTFLLLQLCKPSRELLLFLRKNRVVPPNIYFAYYPVQPSNPDPCILSSSHHVSHCKGYLIGNIQDREGIQLPHAFKDPFYQFLHRLPIEDEPPEDVPFPRKDPIEELSLLLGDMRDVWKEKMEAAAEGSPDRRTRCRHNKAFIEPCSRLSVLLVARGVR